MGETIILIILIIFALFGRIEWRNEQFKSNIENGKIDNVYLKKNGKWIKINDVYQKKNGKYIKMN